jgi:predicted ArsR family transcriptional regulator
MSPIERPRSRDSILDSLKRHGGLTAQALADELGVTPVAVRKHLDALERDGLVHIVAHKQRRGRPILHYHLTPAADARFPQGYRQLSLDLIDELVAIDGEPKLEQLLRARNDKVLRESVDALAPEDRAERIRELVKLRNDDGYMATLDESAEGFVLREHHCPIYEVAAKYPLACRCEADLISEVVQAPVVRVETIVDGGESCTYHVPK